jgi:hypothetical protein
LREILERKQISVVRSMLLHRCACVMRSKVEPMKEVAAMIRHNLAGIVTWAQTRQTNGFLEALNNRFQSAKRRARLHPHVHHFPHTHLSPTHICVSRIGSDAPRSCLRHQRGDIAHPSRMSSSLRILACQVAVLIEVHGPLRPCEAVVEDIDAAISLRRLRDPTSASSSAERSTGAMEVISSPASLPMHSLLRLLVERCARARKPSLTLLGMLGRATTWCQHYRCSHYCPIMLRCCLIHLKNSSTCQRLLIQRTDTQGRNAEVIGQERQGLLGLRVFVSHSAQLSGVSLRGLKGIGRDAPIADQPRAAIDSCGVHALEIHVALGTGDKEPAALMQHVQPCEIQLGVWAAETPDIGIGVR